MPCLINSDESPLLINRPSQRMPCHKLNRPTIKTRCTYLQTIQSCSNCQRLHRSNKNFHSRSNHNDMINLSLASILFMSLPFLMGHQHQRQVSQVSLPSSLLVTIYFSTLTHCMSASAGLLDTLRARSLSQEWICLIHKKIAHTLFLLTRET